MGHLPVLGRIVGTGRRTAPSATGHAGPAVVTIFRPAEITVDAAEVAIDARRKGHLSWHRLPLRANPGI
jgi:hypothetical protein